MKLKNTILLFCLAFSCCFLTSCRSSKLRQETQKVELKSENTVENVTTYEDTIIFAPKAETSFKIPVNQLDFKPGLNGNKKPIYFKQKNAQATAKFKMDNDTISVTATCDSLAIVAKIKKQLQKQTSNNSSNSTSNTLNKQSTGYSIWEIIVAFVVGFGVCFLLKTFKLL